MIIQTVNFSDFIGAFHAHDRSDSFTYEAKQIIFDHLESYSDDSGEPLELDVVAICCDVNEADAAQLESEYPGCPKVADFEGDEDAHREAVEEWLNDQTCLLGVTASGNFVFNCF